MLSSLIVIAIILSYAIFLIQIYANEVNRERCKMILEETVCLVKILDNQLRYLNSKGYREDTLLNILSKFTEKMQGEYHIKWEKMGDNTYKIYLYSLEKGIMISFPFSFSNG